MSKDGFKKVVGLRRMDAFKVVWVCAIIVDGFKAVWEALDHFKIVAIH